MVLSSHQSLRLEKTSASVTSPTPGGMIDFSLRAPQRRCPGAHTASDLPKITDSGRFFHDLAVAFCHARSPHRDERNGTWLAQFRFRATNFPNRGLTPTKFVPTGPKFVRAPSFCGFPSSVGHFLGTDLFVVGRRVRTISRQHKTMSTLCASGPAAPKCPLWPRGLFSVNHGFCPFLS